MTPPARAPAETGEDPELKDAEPPRPPTGISEITPVLVEESTRREVDKSDERRFATDPDGAKSFKFVDGRRAELTPEGAVLNVPVPGQTPLRIAVSDFKVDK